MLKHQTSPPEHATVAEKQGIPTETEDDDASIGAASSRMDWSLSALLVTTALGVAALA